ncbi:Nif3-like dinuclear metal center hexameric protein [Eupransor demetentiae]|uniref:GTP cyclohydrolase 1 type 2 homolog n=1 Tax=Eupransor demetentiae TaxID=3109584 RepID=A0ABM9N3W0_9LACO|nr:NIF3 family (NIF3) [Lactobacillaceae bacterium LMG 33000]
MIKAQDLINKIEAFAPLSIAEKGDPTGLQLGNPDQEIHRVLTTLDVRPETVAEAIADGVDFIWAHHPVMFRPAKNLILDNPQNQMYAALLKHSIVVYASHTNLDAAKGGLNDWLCQAFGVQNAEPLLPNEDGQTGLGRVGTLAQSISLADYALQIKQACQVKEVRIIAKDIQKPIKKVAILGGDGGRWWPDAQKAGADVYITADFYYHTGHDVLSNDFAVIDPDHHMEAIANKPMAAKVVDWFPEIAVQVTQVNTDPYQYL